MKKINIIVLIALFLGLGLSGIAQDQRTLETKVADVLTQMPTHDLSHRDRLMEEMLNMGHSGLTEFAKMIVAPGSGDDTRVRFALGNLAHYVAILGNEEARTLVSLVFIETAEKSDDPGVISFFLYHLNFFGHDEAVPLATKYLNDSELVDEAVAFLQACDSHKSLHAMIDAIPDLSEDNLVVVTQGISTFSQPCVVEPLTKLADHQNPLIHRAALNGLAGAGSPESEKILSKAAKAAGYAYEPTLATASLLKYAESLGENGHLDLSTKICKGLIKNCTDPGQLTYALSAIGILTEQQGFAAMDYLLDGFDHPEKHYRSGVLRHAEKITDIAATREWMSVYEESSNDLKAELMVFFGNRGDQVVLPLVQAGMQSGYPELKKQSMIAYGKLVGKKAIPGLLNVMSDGSSEDVAAAQSVLNTLIGPAETHLLAEQFDAQNKEGKIAILELLSFRQASQYFEVIEKSLHDSDTDIQKAAFAALPSVSSKKQLTKLLTMLDHAGNSEHLEAVQAAVINAALDLEENPAKPVLEAYENASNKAGFIGVLPALGGTDALNTVSTAFADGSPQLKEVAFEALVNWKDYTASAKLFDIVKTNSGIYQKKAFTGYVRQVSTAPIPADQKLLLLKKIFNEAANTEQKASVIDALVGNKTFLTLMFLGELLDESALANAAGRAAASVALPPSGSKEGMYGVEVQKVLKKAIDVIKGEEADYIKANIRSWLEAMPKDDGFVSMFNGENLEGWQGLVKNPIARAQMSEKELAAEQAKADARLPENWTVANGEIRFTGTGYENLCSVKDYADFEMIVDWRISKNGDSGIYLRGTPQVQIWDTSRVDAGAQVGSGGLYNNQKNERIPLVVADNPINDWNTFKIKMVGDRVTVHLNGQLVVDNVILENYWDRAQPIFATGPLELQAHGTDLAFRNIYVREIKRGEYNLSVEEKAEGFESLFNGKNLDGWIGNKTDYVVEEGIVVIRPKQGGHGNLYTEKEYADFNFRFEFQLTPGANNGLGIRTPAEGDAAYAGMELQILDNTAPIYANLQPYQYHGSVYGVIPAKRGFLKPVGEWNSEEVIVQGTRIKVILNGEIIVDGDIADARENGTLDHRDHPGLTNEKGHIGFLGHGSVVKFRNIRIKEL